MSSECKNILVIGMKGTPAAQSTPPDGWNAETIKKAVDDEIEKFAKAGVDLQVYYVVPGSPLIVDEIREILRSKTWDGISIGWAVRGAMEYTPLFEQLVNACIREVQPPPTMFFNERPHKIFEAAQRVYPSLNCN